MLPIKFKFALYIFHRTHLDSMWVRVHLGGVRVHQTRVRVHSAWVRVHQGGVRVRVRVHGGRVRVQTRTQTHPLSPSLSPSPSPSPDSLQHWMSRFFFWRKILRYAYGYGVFRAPRLRAAHPVKRKFEYPPPSWSPIQSNRPRLATSYFPWW